MKTIVKKLIKTFDNNTCYQKLENAVYDRRLEKIHEAQKSREFWLDNVIKNILTSRLGAFIDVGVNVGQTLIKVKSINPDNEYYGFEPNPTCCFYANELIRIKQFKNCKIIPVGLSDKTELLKLLLAKNIDASASVVGSFREKSFYTLEKYVAVFGGDYLLNTLNIKSISIIKIDVEGGELEVIRGLKSSISKYKPYILCEVLPVRDVNTEIGSFRKQRQDLLEKILAEESYKIYRIMHDGRILPLESIEIHSDLSLCDYVFATENQADLLLKNK